MKYGGNYLSAVLGLLLFRRVLIYRYHHILRGTRPFETTTKATDWRSIDSRTRFADSSRETSHQPCLINPLAAKVSLQWITTRKATFHREVNVTFDALLRNANWYARSGVIVLSNFPVRDVPRTKIWLRRRSPRFKIHFIGFIEFSSERGPTNEHSTCTSYDLKFALSDNFCEEFIGENYCVARKNEQSIANCPRGIIRM